MAAAKKQPGDWGLEYFDLYLIHFLVSLVYVDPSHRYPPEGFSNDGKVYLRKHVRTPPGSPDRDTPISYPETISQAHSPQQARGDFVLQLWTCRKSTYVPGLTLTTLSGARRRQ